MKTTFKSFIAEMAKRGGDLSLELSMYYHMYAKDHSKFAKVNSLTQDFDIYLHQNGEVYLIMDRYEKQAAAYFVMLKEGDRVELDTMYVGQDYRGQGIPKMFIAFLLQHHEKIYLGNTHSDDTIDRLSSYARSFDTNWENLETGDIEPYTNDKKYYQTEDWWITFRKK